MNAATSSKANPTPILTLSGPKPEAKDGGPARSTTNGNIFARTAINNPVAEPEHKITILDLIIYCESEIDDIDTWERVLCKENQPLYPAKVRQRKLLRKLVSLLELVKANERELAIIVKRKTDQQEKAAAIERSTARSSKQSTKTNENPEEIEDQSSEP